MKNMNKKLLTTILTFFIALSLNAQGGSWVWIHGSQANSYAGSYGTKGIFSSTNEPPGRYQAAHWTDSNGIFWMFGGIRDGFKLNDLWKYDVATNEWAWVHGPQLTSATGENYGALGVSASSNLPPARGYGAICWTGPDGNLYLFGGQNDANSEMNDLWRYNITLNEWTWIAGTSMGGQLPNYGVLGVPNVSNDPGGRYECGSAWVHDNKLWFFGGAIANVVYNDMWFYDLSTNLWTWIGGNTASNYGTRGVPAASNQPNIRYNYCKWKDQDDNFYMYAGGRLNGTYNDLWKYNPSAMLWTWLGGAQVLDAPNVNNGYCVADVSSIPQARMENQSTQFSQRCATAFWTFGGFNHLGSNFYNDLWVYSTLSEKWTLVWGDPVGNNQLGNYGTKGVTSATNAISARGGGCVWTDKEGSIYIFGGLSADGTLPFAYRGDLWKYVPDTSCFKLIEEVAVLEIKRSDTICVGDTVVIEFPTGAQVVSSPASSSNFNSSRSKLFLYPKAETNYQITYTLDPNGPCPEPKTVEVSIKLKPMPMASFTLSSVKDGASSSKISSLNTSLNADKYVWQYKGNNFSTAKDFERQVSETGEHCFVLTAQNECGIDVANDCITTYSNFFIPNAFSPNGDGKNDFFKIVSDEKVNLEYMRIFNRWGQKVFETYNADTGWDGNLNDVACEIGTYYYIISIALDQGNNESYKGDITLLR